MTNLCINIFNIKEKYLSLNQIEVCSVTRYLLGKVILLKENVVWPKPANLVGEGEMGGG